MLFAKHIAHDKLIHGNQHSQYPKKSKKQPETWTGIRLEDYKNFKNQKIEVDKLRKVWWKRKELKKSWKEEMEWSTCEVNAKTVVEEDVP